MRYTKEELWRIDFHAFIDEILLLLKDNKNVGSLSHSIFINGDKERLVDFEFIPINGGELEVKQISMGGEDYIIKYIEKKLNVIGCNVENIENGIVYRWSNIKQLQEDLKIALGEN